MWKKYNISRDNRIIVLICDVFSLILFPCSDRAKMMEILNLHLVHDRLNSEKIRTNNVNHVSNERAFSSWFIFGTSLTFIVHVKDFMTLLIHDKINRWIIKKKLALIGQRTVVLIMELLENPLKNHFARLTIPSIILLNVHLTVLY